MNRIILSAIIMIAAISCRTAELAQSSNDPVINAIDKIESVDFINGDDPGSYTLIVEGFDWGAAASKVILNLQDSISQISGKDFDVYVSRSTSCQDLSEAEASGKLRVQYAYVSDEQANRLAKGKHVTLVLFTAPFEQIGSPIKYFFANEKCNGNQWIDFQLSIIDTKSHQIWNKEQDKIIPTIAEYDLTGRHTFDNVNLTYASYTPDIKNRKSPLIIWLHGGGEGGTDTTIPLLANRAANYASADIQAYFDGAHVLVPQSPTFWMDKGDGTYTRGEVNDMYNEALMSLINSYVSMNNIDRNRIYIGGCSNGGYMTLKLIMEHPGYFAAAFPSALAYHNDHITEEHLNKIKNEKIWFIHSADDPVTKPDETVVPLYHRLMKAGAKDVHLSYFDHVVDITNQFGGDKFHYNGHFSWIYSHTNKCQLDFDGSPVKLNGKPVSLMGWLAAQRRE